MNMCVCVYVCVCVSVVEIDLPPRTLQLQECYASNCEHAGFTVSVTHVIIHFVTGCTKNKTPKDGRFSFRFLKISVREFICGHPWKKKGSNIIIAGTTAV